MFLCSYVQSADYLNTKKKDPIATTLLSIIVRWANSSPPPPRWTRPWWDWSWWHHKLLLVWCHKSCLGHWWWQTSCFQWRHQLHAQPLSFMRPLVGNKNKLYISTMQRFSEQYAGWLKIPLKGLGYKKPIVFLIVLLFCLYVDHNSILVTSCKFYLN